MQKKVVRIIHHEERLAHTNCLFKQMHSLKCQDLVKYRTPIIMFKLYYGKLPTLLQSRFKRSQNIHNTRSRNTFIVRYSRTNLKAMCISVWGVKLWNALPRRLEVCTYLKLKPKHTYYLTTMSKNYSLVLNGVFTGGYVCMLSLPRFPLSGVRCCPQLFHRLI